ncbi:MAG: efflux transporter outer membrane subunit [Desulfobulbaceae bacterium]|nr:efflux transporter outer membrane subunit [Desulfobulbaceae bacterium]
MKQTKRLPNFLSLSLAGALLAGCTTITPMASMAPPYTQPAAPVPANWPATPTDEPAGVQSGEKATAQIPWQEFFADPQLRQLITLALANNRDLRSAALNIERVRALYQIRGADLWPKVDGNAGVNFQRLSEDFSGNGQAKNLEQYTVGLGVSAYELDLFGRVKSLKEQALAQFFATEQAQRTVQISLVAQVAGGYLTLAADRERLKLAEDTLVNLQASFQITEKRFKAGIATALAVSQAQSGIEAARVEIARYQALVAQDENGLALVLGAPLPTELVPSARAENLTTRPELEVGLPSEVLLARPDIRQAEELLKGYQANIGAARAAFFPRITLVSNLGFGSGQLSDLFSSGSFAWSFAPKVSLPIFDGGSNAANFKVAEVDRDLALAQYEKAIQTAFREVADGLAQRSAIAGQLSAQQALVAANAESLRLSQARFDQGVDSYLSVLDSQRALYGAQQNLIALRQAQSANRVTLYKVLGGGGV